MIELCKLKRPILEKYQGLSLNRSDVANGLSHDYVCIFHEVLFDVTVYT